MKIKKLRINNFKLFENNNFNFSSSSLIILDGPNGFGKTTLFDSVELLLTGKIRRIADNADILEKGSETFKDILVWNSNKSGAIEIRGEFVKDNKTLIYARYVSFSDLKKIINDEKNTIAKKFDYFKLYQLDNFEQKIIEGKEISQRILLQEFGEFFLQSYHLYSYVEQEDNLNLLHKNHKERKNLINHLLDIQDIQEKKKFIEDNTNRLLNEILEPLIKDKENAEGESKDIKKKIVKAKKDEIPYKKIFPDRNDIGWDKPNPKINDLSADLEKIDKIISLLNNKKGYREYLKNKDNNTKIDNILARRDFLEGIIVYSNFDSKYKEFESINKKREQFLLWQSELKEDPFSDEVSFVDLLTEFNKLEWQPEIERLLAAIQELEDKEVELSEQHRQISNLRTQLIELHNEINVDHGENCPLCGHDWETKGALDKAIRKKTKGLEVTKSKISKEIEKLEKEYNEKYIKEILLLISNLLKSKELTLDEKFFDQLKPYHKTRLSIIDWEKKIIALGLDLTGIKITKAQKITQTELNKKLSELLELLEKKKSKVSGNLGEHDATYRIYFKNNPEDLEKIELKDLKNKKLYLEFFYYSHQQKELQRLTEQLKKIETQIDEVDKFKKNKVQKILSVYTEQINEFTDKFLKEIALYFYLYSGRILQNYAGGLGIIIDTKDKAKILFKSKLDTDHDALLNMSSGQLSALVLAFSLCLNRIYSQNSFLFIDDPLQTMDELNMASFVEILRNEFADRQILFSTHESPIANYMSYKYGKYNLGVTRINMKERTLPNESNKD